MAGWAAEAAAEDLLGGDVASLGGGYGHTHSHTRPLTPHTAQPSYISRQQRGLDDFHQMMQPQQRSPLSEAEGRRGRLLMCMMIK